MTNETYDLTVIAEILKAEKSLTSSEKEVIFEDFSGTIKICQTEISGSTYAIREHLSQVAKWDNVRKVWTSRSRTEGFVDLICKASMIANIYERVVNGESIENIMSEKEAKVMAAQESIRLLEAEHQAAVKAERDLYEEWNEKGRPGLFRDYKVQMAL